MSTNIDALRAAEAKSQYPIDCHRCGCKDHVYVECVPYRTQDIYTVRCDVCDLFVCAPRSWSSRPQQYAVDLWNSAASKPEPRGCSHCLGGKVDATGPRDCGYPNCVGEPEPQAQAGEPLTKDDILRMARTGGGELSCVAEPLEHPWKFSESELIRFASLLILAERERTGGAIAKKDAALKACVEALKNSDEGLRDDVYQAIIQGEGAL